MVYSAHDPWLVCSTCGGGTVHKWDGFGEWGWAGWSMDWACSVCGTVRQWGGRTSKSPDLPVGPPVGRDEPEWLRARELEEAAVAAERGFLLDRDRLFESTAGSDFSEDLEDALIGSYVQARRWGGRSEPLDSSDVFSRLRMRRDLAWFWDSRHVGRISWFIKQKAGRPGGRTDNGIL